MIGYKGFDKNFCCRGMQYEVGKTYELDGDLKLCERGFHFCDLPLAVLAFYQPTNSRFALIEASGDILHGDSHKLCTKKIAIVKELSLDELIKAAEKTSSNTGDYSAATNTGDRSAVTNTGTCSAAAVEGKNSLAVAFGCQSHAKGSLGSWIVISQWSVDKVPVDVQCFKVDGVKIKPDTFYTLKDGAPVELKVVEF